MYAHAYIHGSYICTHTSIYLYPNYPLEDLAPQY